MTSMINLPAYLSLQKHLGQDADKLSLLQATSRCSALLFCLASQTTHSGTCSELPHNSHLKTNTEFPVKKGTEVVVTCVEGYTFTSGDRVITCVQDAEFTVLGSFPSCTVGEFI